MLEPHYDPFAFQCGEPGRSSERDMTEQLVWSSGTVVRGHRVASGLCGDPRFPEGTIRPQLGAFRALIPNFDAHLGGEPFPGTVNVRLDAGAVVLGTPEHSTGPIRWTEAFGPENFLLSTCLLEHRGARHRAFLYVPDPATKPDHLQMEDVIEVLAPFVPGLDYGDGVSIGRAKGIFSAGAP